jgi:hypothetical protein
MEVYSLASKVKSRVQMRRVIILSYAGWIPHYHVSSRVQLCLHVGHRPEMAYPRGIRVLPKRNPALRCACQNVG